MGQMKKFEIGPNESIETGKSQIRQIRDFWQDSVLIMINPIT